MDQSIDDDTTDEEIVYVIRFPPSSKKILNFNIKNGDFFVISPINYCDDHYQLIKVKNLPINQVSGSTWIDVRIFTRENTLYRKSIFYQIQINEIYSKIDNLKKISKGTYSLSRKNHQRLNSSVINKLKF